MNVVEAQSHLANGLAISCVTLISGKTCPQELEIFGKAMGHVIRSQEWETMFLSGTCVPEWGMEAA